MNKRWQSGRLWCPRFPAALVLAVAGLALLIDVAWAGAQEGQDGSDPPVASSGGQTEPEPDAQPDWFTVDFVSYAAGDPGSEALVADVEVPVHLQGRQCQATVSAHNGASVHPGNDLIVRSTRARAEIIGVEEDSGADVTGVGDLVVDERIEVWLRFGPDGRSSLDFDLAIRCPLPTPEVDGDVAPPAASPVPVPTEETPPAIVTPPSPVPTLETPPAKAVDGEPTYTG